jgi:hypothetical protein
MLGDDGRGGMLDDLAVGGRSAATASRRSDHGDDNPEASSGHAPEP